MAKELDRFNTKAKRNISISVMLMFIMTFAVLISSIGIAFISIAVFNKEQLKESEDSVAHSAYGVRLTLEDWCSSLEGYADTLSDRPDVFNAVVDSNGRWSSSLERIVSEKAEDLDIEILAVVDLDGKVIAARGAVANSDVSSAYVVRQTLDEEEYAFAFEGFGETDYAVLASAPIYDEEGELIAALVAGYDLIGGDFVDTINESYNVDCTVYKSNKSMISTLEDSDEESLNDKAIIDTVLEDGEEYKGISRINGVAYYSIYFPLLSGDDSITGMIFVAKSMEAIEAVKNRTVNIIIFVVIIFVIVLVLIGFVFTRWLMKRIYNVTNFLKEMATGEADLTKRVKLLRRDEVGDLVINFDAFCDKLQQIVGEVKKSKEELNVNGEQMTQGTRDTSSAIEEIISNIDGMQSQIHNQTNSVSDTAGAVNQIASNIESLEHMIENQGNCVSQASAAVEEMIGNIKSVNQSVDKMATSFTELSQNADEGIRIQENVNEQIKQIESQSEMLQEANLAISSIAEQTNLLAMNAAIEAAHAGEAGKGFAVVADEIRKLSETSTAQSKTIGEQLNNIKNSITDVVTASTASSTAFEAVSNKIRQTDELVMQIKAAMDEQNTGSQQISDALHTMNDSTVEVRNASGEMTEGNKAILENVRNLQEVTGTMTKQMEEMSNGAKKINETGKALSEISTSVQNAISKIGNQIDLFTV